METKNTIDVRDILAIIARRKWLIILPAFLITISSFVATLFMEKRYHSSTMVYIDQSKYLSRELQAMVPIADERRMSREESRNYLIAIKNEIVSSTYLAQLIDELKLNEDPALIERARGKLSGQTDVSLEQLVYHMLFERLRGEISVSFNGENIVEIGVESYDPNMAMNIAKKLAEIFKKERLNQEIDGVRDALSFSDEQLAIYRRNLDEAEQKKADYESQYLKDRLDESVVADTNVHAIMADIDNIKLMIEDNIQNQIDIRSNLGSFSRSQLELRTNADYDRLKNNIFNETERLANFMSKYTWSDPKVLSANERVIGQQENLEDVTETLINRQFSEASETDMIYLKEYFILQTREMVLRQKQRNFEVALSVLRDKISRQPEIEVQLHNLTNDVASAREIYEKFKDQVTGSEISQSIMRGGAETKYRIIEPASIPLEPYKPERTKITILGAVLGLIIGGALTLLAELLDSSFKKVDDVEDFLGVPVLATIPNVGSVVKRAVKI